MMTEDFVSFETAKLLKEKGFDAECHSYYYPCHYPDGSIQYHKYAGTDKKNRFYYEIYSLKNLPKDHYLAPTLQMAMKWLREVHTIIIELHHQHRKEWYAIVSSENPLGIGVYTTSTLNTYEQAAEAAIKYCLENLI